MKIKINEMPTNLEETVLNDSLLKSLQERLGCLVRHNHKTALGYLFNSDIKDNPGLFCLREKEIDKTKFNYFYSLDGNKTFKII